MKELTINGQQIIVHSNGDITKTHYKAVVRTSGFITTQGIRAIRIGNKKFSVHRLVAEAYLADFDEGLRVRHHKDRTDNQPENLFMASVSETARSHRGKCANSSSKYRGVCKATHAGKWLVNIRNNDKRIHIGHFDDEDEAGRAWNHAALAAGYPRESLNKVPEAA